MLFLLMYRYFNNIFIIEMIVGGLEEDYYRKVGWNGGGMSV